MRGLNKAMLIGNVGRDPEIRHTESGMQVATFSVATSSQWNDKNSGERKEKTEWHNVVAFNKLADIIEKWVKSGTLVFVEGSLQTRTWQDKDGADRYKTEIVAVQLTMLGGSKREDTKAPYSGTAETKAYAKVAKKEESKNEDFDDDIPF